MAEGQEPRGDRLDEWMHGVAHALTSLGLRCRYEYDDRLLGDVMVLAIDGDGGLIEIIVTRHGRGVARIAVIADRHDDLRALVAAVGELHHQVPRKANSRRRFVHRIVRVLRAAAADDAWARAQRAAAAPPAPAAMAALTELFPGATWMYGAARNTRTSDGRGKGDDPDERGRLRVALAAAVAVDGGHGPRRALVFDAAQGAFVIRGAALARAQRARGVAFSAAGAALAGFGLVLAESGLTDSELAELAEQATRVEASADGFLSGLAETACDCVDVSALCDADLLSIVPDCDLGGCDSLDCSW